MSDINTARAALLRNVNDFAGRPSVHSGDIFSHNGHAISFGNYSPAWRMQRKIAHGALKLYSAGMDKLEKVILREIQEVFQQFDQSGEEPHDPHCSISLGSAQCHLCINSWFSVQRHGSRVSHSRGIERHVCRNAGTGESGRHISVSEARAVRLGKHPAFKKSSERERQNPGSEIQGAA